MQLFVKKSDGRTVVVEASADETVWDVKERVAVAEGIPGEELRLLFSGRQLEDSNILSQHHIKDGATVYSALRLLGGAAEKAKKLAEALAYKTQMAEEYDKWFTLADQTKTTGIMRLLCVSMTLDIDKNEVHGPEEAWSGPSAEPDAKDYDLDHGDDPTVPPSGTGYETQEAFDKDFKEIFDLFGQHFQVMKERKDQLGDGDEAASESSKRYYTYNRAQYEQLFETQLKLQNMQAPDDDAMEFHVVLECASGREGLWFKGPARIVRNDTNEVIWDFAESCANKDMWCKEGNNGKGITKDPWRIGGQYQSLERWFFEGIGTTTFTMNSKGKLVLWSQEDLTGDLGLTDGERRRLADQAKLAAKELLKDESARKLDFQEQELQKDVNKVVETGPCHNPEYGIFQFRVKSLKKMMHKKCVFWTNTEHKVPGGSVADKTKTIESSGGEDLSLAEKGAGFEVVQFWKYKKKIGIMRKRDILADRQRLLDQLEIFTPTYKAVIKRSGADADDDGGSDHYMVDDYQKKITNICALALDTHMPDYEEDRIACMIKTLIEHRAGMGPTWHVLVGRRFGFAVQCEARHFIHLYMQHLAIVIWKSEPDPNAGKKPKPVAGQAGELPAVPEEVGGGQGG